ncbi:uncharacterized protein N0V89_010166 [Didymosphaeria variabile]|uniref:Uncharacterized protein n=1 Tax=Didymosphaeria variabile TaxID=1932322 RepID=A0A9W8XH15_9PLEO|nr:uncharacterized protein N0V89_010166 [Didymosphaeria variabile]KAJ4348788.1 hypothetical protein N0V89_010166 [Didymosphaeria variabile]
MGWFTSTKEAASTPTEPTTEGGSRLGVGAEQDRYSSHFNIPEEEKERLKQQVRDWANKQGSGAEQDRYASHFSLQNDPVAAAARWLANTHLDSSGAEQDRWGGYFGLGADGWARAKKLSETQGVGAEQDRYGSHFSIDTGSVKRAALSVQEGVKQARNQ